MIPYKEFRYLFPPRPEKALPSNVIPSYEARGEYGAQPKLNGDCLVVFMNGKQTILMDRHNTTYTKSKIDLEIASLYRETIAEGIPTNKWMVLTGEYMAKSQKQADGSVWNHKFVIHDIIVYDGMQLVGDTFEERVDLLDRIYGTDDKEITPTGIKQLDFLYSTTSKECYRVKTYYHNLDVVWGALVAIGMYEGLVFKKLKARLENGIKVANNSASMFKFRKETRNYTY